MRYEQGAWASHFVYNAFCAHFSFFFFFLSSSSAASPFSNAFLNEVKWCLEEAVIVWIKEKGETFHVGKLKRMRRCILLRSVCTLLTMMSDTQPCGKINLKKSPEKQRTLSSDMFSGPQF